VNITAPHSPITVSIGGSALGLARLVQIAQSIVQDSKLVEILLEVFAFLQVTCVLVA
jgi:hypothetical protein